MHKKLPLKILDLFGTSCFLTKFVQLFFYILILICTLSCKFFDDSHGSSSSSLFWGGSCDWLILGYMDADNNLNDSLYIDLINEQIGLANLSDSASVKILTLWDGYNTGNHYHPNGALYELGPVDRTSYNTGLNNSGFTMSSSTKDLTAYAWNWLGTEPDMSDVSTLRNFLSFAAMNYSASNVVLLLSDHGAGTEYETESGGYGGRRSLASDDTNGARKLLTATDIKNAIASSGLHVNVIWMDCCLQGNVETTYALRGIADYLVSSANSSYSNNHAAIISGINASTTPLSFATSVVQAYADTHKDGIIQMSATDRRASFDTMPTQSAYSLDTEKQNTLYNAIEALANALITAGDSICTSIYTSYLKQASSVTSCQGMAFPGSFAYLNDIGYLCKNLKNNSNSSVSSAANSVLRALDSVIVSSWLGRTESESRNYYKKNVTGISSTVLSSSDGTFGLTIATQLNPDIRNSFLPLYSNYEDVTDYSTSWGVLMQKWHTGEY